MAWLQLHLTTDKERAPLIEQLFETLGALSVTLVDAGDEPILELGPGETRLWSQIRATGLFPGDRDPDGLRAELTQALQADICRHLTLEVLDDREWERSWLDHFHPMRFGRRLWIRPNGQAIEQPDALVVDLDPGLAFGTGTHPTTALCLEWLDGADLAGKTLIDFGCGSGILAIAALKLGARLAFGADHDPQAILASRDNAEKNNLSSRLLLFGPGETLPEPADILVANILSGTLIDLAGTLAGWVRPGGDLLLSGILAQQAAAVADAFKFGFHMAPPREREGWVLLHGVRLG
ncbi:MAG: 50S ribosomal protein L11 methyltransferase [Gammaproteobacteria bacterium]|nr:50S ribosomal protein L11 methyltransferase [Gammaproteobacteria bacterium]MBU1653432.1 50S ribosomal protein L11 methyltransferase [Gammaproteobacteria bacterium]MBU1959737.1 50S ribosomal protein L11 methyltransferase [Gammaproteobacteria bacterium]